MAQAQGFDALNAYLERKYNGKNLLHTQPSIEYIPRPGVLETQGSFKAVPKARKESFMEVSLDQIVSEEDSVRLDLETFYRKHDPSKLGEDKFAPVLKWAMRIGRTELDKRFKEKYGESISELKELLADAPEGGSGSASFFLVRPTSDQRANSEDMARQLFGYGEEEKLSCTDYQEAKPYQSFGVCVCGFSRIDHVNFASILIPGRAKVTVVPPPPDDPPAASVKLAAPVAETIAKKPSFSPPAASPSTSASKIAAKSSANAVPSSTPAKSPSKVAAIPTGGVTVRPTDKPLTEQGRVSLR